MSIFKKVDYITTIKGSTFLFIITSLVIMFILNIKDTNKTKDMKDKSNKYINYIKNICLSLVLSFIFTFIIAYISIKVDEQDLAKK